MRSKYNQFIRTILLSIACYIAFGSFTAQAEVPKVGMQPIIANASTNTFFDRESIRLIKDPYKDALLLEAWIKTNDNTPNGGYNLTKYYIRLEPRQYQQIKSIDYDSNDVIVEQDIFIYSETKWKEVVPGSLADAWYHQILQYAQENKIIAKRGAKK